ncbi:MAG: PAS domain S-box protein [Caldisericia bacterium]|nr:PAS domain S-box protein [Caldisericia bacterium]
MNTTVGFTIVIGLLTMVVLIEIYLYHQKKPNTKTPTSEKNNKENISDTSNLFQVFQQNVATTRKIDKIFQQAPIGMILYDDNGSIVKFNKAAIEIFGVSNPGQNFDRVNMLDSDRISKEQKNELKKGKSLYRIIKYNFEKIRKDQEYDTIHRGERTIKATIIPMIDEIKLWKKQYVGFYEDITEIEEYKYNKNELLKFTNTVFWNYDPEKKVFFGGNDLKELMNLEFSESGKVEASLSDLIAFIHPDDRKLVKRAIDKQLADEGVNDYYLQFRAVNKNKVIYIDSFTHQKIEDGKVLFSTGVIQDVSKRMIYRDAIRGISKNIVLKQGETYLKAMLREMAEVLDSTASGLFFKNDETGAITTKYVWNNNKKVLLTNDYFCHKQIRTYLENTFIKNNNRFDFIETEKLEGCLKDELQKKGILLLGVHTLQDSRKKTIGIVTIMFDNEVEQTIQLKQIFSMFASGVSSEIERMQNLKQLEIALKRAKTASSAKSTFLSTISHEIRTPLNSIIGFTKLLKNENLSEKGESYLQTVMRSSEALLDTIEDILDITKLEAERISLQYEPLNVPNIMQEIFDIFYISLKEKNIKYKQEFPKDFPEMLMDGVRFRQIMMNIISNAIKFTHEGEISVNIRLCSPILTNELIVSTNCKPSNYIAMFVTVKDTGVGIPKEDQVRIFEPFEQQKNQKQQGIGLGLAISNSLISLMGGSIQLKSNVGEGSTFTMYFPCLEKAYPTSEPKDISCIQQYDTFELEEATAEQKYDLAKGIPIPIIKKYSLLFGPSLRTLRHGLSITLVKNMAEEMVKFAEQNNWQTLAEEANQLKKTIYLLDLDHVDDIIYRLRSLL